ncbi:MAG: (Fe-S)-binding protein [Candidatus Aenigmarchaeota archaeon]|nr:(Fe-S)-binding protein [Candidatus Aenigmarchaeota archaeon]
MKVNLLRKLRGGNTLYYEGCLTKAAARDIGLNYRILLKKAGIEFIELFDKEICCASPLISCGKGEEAEKLMQKNLELFKSRSVRKIIASCPGCSKVFSVDYPKILGDAWDIEVEHISHTLSRAIGEGKLDVKKLKTYKGTVTFHDPCHLGRYSGVYEEPRKVLEAAGCRIKEMKLTRERALCCGGGAGVRSNHEILSSSIAKERAGMAKETGAGVLVTCCPMCYLNLKENAGGLKVVELSQVLRTEKDEDEDEGKSGKRSRAKE